MLLWLNIFVVVFTCLLIAFSLKAAFEFRSYCEDIAKTEGREAEFGVLSSDENSLNAYEREQFKRLMRGDFAHIGNEEVLARSLHLAARLKRLRAVTFLFVIAVGAMYLSL
jgi:hypothetical protein